MDRAREKKNIQRTKKGEKSHQNKFFIAKCAIEKKHVWIRFFFLLLQSNKVWSCESHIARACGDSHKKILFSSYFLCVYSVQCALLLFLLFIYFQHRLAAGQISAITHTFMLLNCPLRLSISKSSSVWYSKEEKNDTVAIPDACCCKPTLSPLFSIHIFCLQSVK